MVSEEMKTEIKRIFAEVPDKPLTGKRLQEIAKEYGANAFKDRGSWYVSLDGDCYDKKVQLNINTERTIHLWFVDNQYRLFDRSRLPKQYQ